MNDLARVPNFDTLDYWSKNPYSNPENWLLDIVDTLEAGGGYDFDTCVVWQHQPTGRFFGATDSGCSCPTPFESIEDWSDLVLLPNWFALNSFVTDWISGQHDEQTREGLGVDLVDVLRTAAERGLQ